MYNPDLEKIAKTIGHEWSGTITEQLSQMSDSLKNIEKLLEKSSLPDVKHLFLKED